MKRETGACGSRLVGIPIAVEFAKHINVIGIDINGKRIEEYSNGIDCTNEVSEDRDH